MLLPILKNKLPKEINLLLSRTFHPKKGFWEIQEIMKELRVELEARGRCITEKEAKRDKVYHPVYSITDALMEEEGLKCFHCQASQFSDKRDLVTNKETRNIIKVAEEMFQLHQEKAQFKKPQIKKDLFQV